MKQLKTKLSLAIVLVLSHTAVIADEPKGNTVKGTLNDTGLGETKYSNFQTDYYFYRKDVMNFPGQDPDYGRDAARQKDDLETSGSGPQGFDFSGEGDCLVDHVTGLMWELKTDASDESLQSNKWTFKWNQDEGMSKPEPVPESIETAQVKDIPESQPNPIYEDIEVTSEVLFDYDQAVLTEAALEALKVYQDKIVKNAARIKSITVIGHTDGIASQRYNLKLSQSRAQAVANHLQSVDGIPDTNIEAIGKGKLEPVASNDTEAGRAQNRRVVIRLEMTDNQPLEEVVAEPIAEAEPMIAEAEKPVKTEAPKTWTSEQKDMKAELSVMAKCSDEKNYQCTTREYISIMNENSLCGYNDWRLPTREELRSIVHYGVSMPAVDTDEFSHMISSAYWTATAYVSNPFAVWVVDFEHGGDNAHEKHRALPIILVRENESAGHTARPAKTKADPSTSGETTDSDKGLLEPITKPVVRFWNKIF